MKLTNAQLAKKESFIERCKEAGVDPTPRQASKFRNHHGKLWTHLNFRKSKKEVSL